VSCLITGYHGIDNVCLSVPTVLNSKGVDSRIVLPFSEDELKGLKHSARVLSEAIEQVGLAD
jgi:L-lactate dehydrogenase